MQSLITSYLIQTGECSLAEIGTFSTTSKPAMLDIANKQILPPTSQINFSPGATQNSPGLIKYIAQKKGYSTDVAENFLNDFCNEWKERLDTGEALIFETLGSLQKNNNGEIAFQNSPTDQILKPVIAERVLHENAEHNVLVGDNEVSSNVVPGYEIDEPVTKKNKWWIWAAMLAVTGLAVIIYHFSNHAFISSTTGNQTNIIIDSAASTHSEIQGN